MLIYREQEGIKEITISDDDFATSALSTNGG